MTKADAQDLNLIEAFFRAVKKYDFNVQAIVVDKQPISSTRLHNNKSHFYRYVMKCLIKNNPYLLSEAIVKIDGNGSKEFRKKLKQYLSQGIRSGSIKKLRFIDSKSDNLIQLADMIVGAITHSYTGHKDKDYWIKMLGKRIADILELSRPRSLV